MSEWNKKIFRLVLTYAGMIALISVFIPRQLDWSPSFSRLHNQPYGAEALEENMYELFDSEHFLVNENSLTQLMKDTFISNTNYVLVNTSFDIDSIGLFHLFQFVDRGNNAFISAETISSDLIDSLGVQIGVGYNGFSSIEDLNNSSINLSLTNADFEEDKTYVFRNQWTSSYFEKIDSSNRQIFQLGTQDSFVNFIKVPFGNGNFYLHSFPYAFTNFYLMKNETREYISSAFSYLPRNYDVIWDEYYKPYRENVQLSPLRVVLQYPSLRWAYWLIFIGIILYLLFGSKRRQRIIPIIEAPRNESLKFIQTLGSLYFNKGSNHDILTKKVKVFKDFVGQKYVMKDMKFSTEEAELLASKSGINITLIKEIFELAHSGQRAEIVTDGQLKLIINKINEFYGRKI